MSTRKNYAKAWAVKIRDVREIRGYGQDQTGFGKKLTEIKKQIAAEDEARDNARDDAPKKVRPVSRNTVSDWENEKRPPSRKNQEAIARLAGVSLDALRQEVKLLQTTLEFEAQEIGEKLPLYDQEEIDPADLDIDHAVALLVLYGDLETNDAFTQRKENEPLLRESSERCRTHLLGFVQECWKLRSSVYPRTEYPEPEVDS